MAKRIARKFKTALERRFPEKRLFLRSDNDTRFIRLSATSQLLAWSGGIFFVAWTIIATAVLLMDSIGSGNLREQAKREQLLYENRLNLLSEERDMRAAEALMAQERFNTALGEISKMQTALLQIEDRRREMEKGIEAIQATLLRTKAERDAARTQLAMLEQQSADGPVLASQGPANGETETTLDFLADALNDTAAQRDEMAEIADRAESYVAELELERDLLLEKNDRIFSQLEDAVSLSLEPLDKMFAAVGMSTDRILETVRQGYSGQGGPLTPLTFSTRGEAPDADSMRANAILQKLDEMNLYRIAAEKIPLGMPVRSSFRFTSGFGPRWGRMHAGTDFAASYGTPIYATADGVVTHAGWSSGYGRLVKIKHAFGLETRYAHQSKIRVKVGQKVSRGDRIGDMGNSGRSTGTHLHYEVRLGNEAVNPMTYIKAGKDVF